MLTQPPIEGNLDCRAWPFHSELCFDITAFQDPTLIHFTIDGRHGILGARHIAKGLEIPMSQPNSIILKLGQILWRWSLDSKKGSPLRSPLQDVRRIFLWASSSDPGSPSLFRREAARRASPRHIPEGITVAAPAIPRAPPAAPASSQPSTSAEPRMAIPISEYRELCRALETLTASQSSLAQEMAAIRACQEQMLATQAQQAAILRQLQVHFDLRCRALHFYSSKAIISSSSLILRTPSPGDAPQEATHRLAPPTHRLLYI
ncbi:hypothetical protein AAG906_028066 [Vitis piasezkii]